MISRTLFFAIRTLGRLIGLSAISLQVFSFAFAVYAQEVPSDTEVRSEVKHVGTAEVRSVFTPNGKYPSSHPKVYWHDADWNIDMVPEHNPDGKLTMKIVPANGSTQYVTLERYFAQVDSISRAPDDKAIAMAEANGTSEAFIIVDLKTGAQIDQIGMYHPSISPNRRFILYINGYPAHGDVAAATKYRLYDTLKTPKENTCAYRQNDPGHKDLNETYRGFPVYPRKANQITCSDADDLLFEEEDHDLASDFVWSPDSNTVIFADIKDGIVSLVSVSMPVGTRDLPKTSVYTLAGAEDVCAGATDAAGQENCDYHVIQSLGWDDDVVKAVFRHQFGTKLDLEMTIPVSKFIPIGR